MSKSGEEVFSEARSLLFKTVRVRRLYDADANALIYVSFSTRFDKNDDANKSRFKSSICAVPLYDNEVSATGAAP
jgi:catabolite regulation protein CreA